MKTLIQQLHTQKKKLVHVLLGSIALLFVVYSFGIASTTINIADAKMYDQDINELQTEIAELEVEYFEIINILSIDEAEKYGFTETSNLHYAYIDKTKAVAYNL